jgi:hypothetical protein
MFKRRMKKTGRANKKEVEVLSGFQAEEAVVSSGGYLLIDGLTLRQGVKRHVHAD